MKKHIPSVILIIVFVLGLGIFLYPTVSNWINTREQNRVIKEYDNAVLSLDKAKYQEMLDGAHEYNRLYAKNNFADTTDTENGTELYRDTLNVRNGVMGYLVIDSLDIRLPIYHGSSSSVLQMGIGHLPMTSLPVGGIGTHAVLSGHSGLPSAELLSKLDRMKEGDVFFINVLDEVLAYEVREIRTVLPPDVDSLFIDPEEDKVSLVTCTPYGVNTHRLIITGYRIPYEAPETDVSEETVSENGRNSAVKENSVLSPYKIAVFAIAATAIIALPIILIARKKHSERKGVKSEKDN